MTAPAIDLPAIGTPCTVNHPRYGRIACTVSGHKSYGVNRAFVCQDTTKTYISANGEPAGWLCWPDDIGGFVSL